MRSRIPSHCRRGCFSTGKEDHADAVFAGLGQREAQLLAFAREELVRNLDQHAGAVAGFRIAAASAAMRQVEEDLNAFADDVVAFVAVDAGDKPDPAGIVLVRGVVEALSGGQSIRVETRRHGLRPADGVPFESFVLGAGIAERTWRRTLLLSNRNSLLFNIAYGEQSTIQNFDGSYAKFVGTGCAGCISRIHSALASTPL